MIIWHNVRTAPQRWIASWLRRRGWVVFYLEHKYRGRCSNPGCWMNLYDDSFRP